MAFEVCEGREHTGRAGIEAIHWSGLESLEPRLLLAGDIAVTVDALETSDVSPTLTGTVNSPAASVTVTVDGTQYNAVNNRDGTWTLDGDLLPDLAEGRYDVRVDAINLIAGTFGWDDTFNELKIDTTDPAATVYSQTTPDTTPTLTGTIDDPTATILVQVDGQSNAAVNNGNGTWSLSGLFLTAMNPGTYDVTVTATDGAGNQGVTTAVGVLVIDVAVPQVTVNSTFTTDPSPELTGTVSDVTATVDVTVDGQVHAATNNGNGTWTLAAGTIAPALADGSSYTVSVTATVGAEVGSAEGLLLVNSAAPVVTVNDLITAQPLPEVTGTIDGPASSLSIVIDGVTYTSVSGQVKIDAENNFWWIEALTSPLSLGGNAVDATATAVTGETALAAGTVTLDLTAPTATMNALKTSDPRPELTGTVDDPTATIYVKVYGETYEATNNGDGTWTLADNVIDIDLPTAVYDVTLVTVDVAGNDRTTTIQGILQIGFPVTVNTLLTNQTSPELTGTILDDNAGIAVNVSINGNSYGATNNMDGTWTLPAGTIAPALADGIYTVEVWAEGALDHTMQYNSVTIDTVLPVVTVVEVDTNVPSPTITGTIDKTIASMTVTINGVDYTSGAGQVVINNAAGTWSIAAGTIVNLLPGRYDVTAVATDGAGNEGLLDATDAITINITVTVNALTTNVASPAITGTVTDPDAEITVTIEGNSYPATNNGNGTWTLAAGTIAPLTEGSHTVTVLAENVAEGLTAEAAGTVTVDTVIPVPTVTKVTTTNTSPAIGGTSSEPIASARVTLNGVEYTSGAGQVTINGYNWSIAAGTIAPALEPGVYSVAVTVTDAGGNEGTTLRAGALQINITLTVNQQTVSNNRPQITGTINDPQATVKVTVNGFTYDAVNNGNGTWTLPANTIPAFRALPDGTYNVTVSATDVDGTTGSTTATGALIVRTQGPGVVINKLTTADTSPQLTGSLTVRSGQTLGLVTVTVNGQTFTSNNAVSISDAYAWTLPAGVLDDLAPGAYNIVVTAADQFGNVTTETLTGGLVITFAVGFEETGSSSPSPELNGTIADPDATVKVKVNGVSYDAVNNGDGTWTLAAGTIANLADGTYEVTVNAVNPAGGTGEAQADLIIDTTAPVVTARDLETSNTTPPLSGTVTEANLDVLTVVLSKDGLVVETYTSNDYITVTNGVWTLSNTITPLARDTYDVTVTATDIAGNVSEPATATLTIDEKPHVDNLVTKDKTPTITGTVVDGTTAVAVRVLLVNPFIPGDTFDQTYNAVNNGDGTWTLDGSVFEGLPGGGLPDGVYEVTAEAVVGGESSPGTLTVDTTAPVVTVNFLTTSYSRPTLTGTITDFLEIVDIQVNVNGTNYLLSTGKVTYDQATGIWTLPGENIATPIGQGTRNVTVSALDAADNVGQDNTSGELDVIAPQTFTIVAAMSIYFYDADGTKVTVTSRPNKGFSNVLTLTFDANSAMAIEHVFGQKYKLVSEFGATLTSMNIVTDLKYVSVTTSGGSISGTVIGSIIGNGRTSSFRAPNCDLIGTNGIAINLLGGVIEALNIRSITGNVYMGGLNKKGVSFSVKNAVTNSLIQIPNTNVTSFTAGSMINSRLYVGVAGAPNTMPAVDSLSNRMIKKVTIKGIKGQAGSFFENSFIAADNVGSVSLKDINTDNGGNAFGVTANTFKTVSIKQSDPKASCKISGKNYTGLPVDLGDFNIVTPTVPLLGADAII